MIARLRSRLSYANVASSLALFLALSTGTAYAANEWTGANIVDQSLTAADLKIGTIGTARVLNDSLMAEDLASDSVTASELAATAVDSADVADESLTANDLATDSVNATEIANDSIDSGEIVNDPLLASDLAAASVGASEIPTAPSARRSLASNVVTGAKVASNSLTTADIAGADVNGGGISVPAGYVPNGRCRQLDASVGGATAGEAVIFSVKAALQDGILIYGQRVPSNGHVTFSVCNFSGTTQAAISDIPVRVITFG